LVRALRPFFFVAGTKVVLHMDLSLAAPILLLAAERLLLGRPSNLPIPKACIAVIFLLTAATHGKVPATPLLLGCWPGHLPIAETLVAIKGKVHGAAELRVAHATPSSLLLGPSGLP